MKRTSKAAFLHPLMYSFAILTLGACGDELATTESLFATHETRSTPSHALNASTQSFIVSKDTRRCQAPLCGGYWVSAANHAETACADGTRADKCYVATIDWQATGLTPNQTESIITYTHDAVVRGSVVQDDHIELGVLKAELVFRSAAPNPTATRGDYFEIVSNGIMCVTSPCFNMDQIKLNSDEVVTISSMGGTENMIQAAHDGLSHGSIVIVGYTRPVANAGPAGAGVEAIAFQVFERIVEPHRPDPFACETNEDCIITGYRLPVTSEDECYCFNCPVVLLNRRTAFMNQIQWEKHCEDAQLRCVLMLCFDDRPRGCVANRCTYLD